MTEKRSIKKISSTTNEVISIQYPKTFGILEDRIQATKDDFAAWVFDGPNLNGLSAYKNANEIDSPPRFLRRNLPFDELANGIDESDYVSPLMSCWFKQYEITKLKLERRYMTL